MLDAMLAKRSMALMIQIKNRWAAPRTNTHATPDLRALNPGDAP